MAWAGGEETSLERHRFLGPGLLALVGIHPFGGFNMSGTDSKTGGPDYLLHYTQAKSVAERL